MSRTIAILSVAGLAVCASADVQIFLTPMSGYADVWAEPGPANVYAPSGMHSVDYTADGYVPAPNWANWPTAPQMYTLTNYGDPAYIWMHFDDNNGLPVNGARLDGIQLVLHEVGSPYPAANIDIAYYVMDDTYGLGSKRWDGDLGSGGINFKQNPQTLVAATASGVVNTSANRPENLYRGGIYAGPNRTVLLGAVRLPAAIYTYSLGPLGIHFNTGGTPNVQFGVFDNWTPEPQTALLLVVAGVLCRRRG